MEKKTLTLILLILLVSFFSFGCTWTSEKSETRQAQINITPNSGVPGTKLIITGTGFIPQEKVKVILYVQNVQLQFGTSGSGGISEVNQDGTFRLEPVGGVPKASTFVTPGVYKVDAIGDKGSLASAQLEVLLKK